MNKIKVRPEFKGYVTVEYNGMANAKYEYKRLRNTKDPNLSNVLAVMMTDRPKSKDEWEDVIRSVIADLYNIEIIYDNCEWHMSHPKEFERDGAESLIRQFAQVRFAFALDNGKDTVLNCPIKLLGNEAYVRQVVNVVRLTYNISEIHEITDKLY